MEDHSIAGAPAEHATTTTGALAPAQGTKDPLASVVLGLEDESALVLRATFAGLFERAAEWRARAAEICVTSVDQKREMKLARESRLALREIRVKGEHERKRLKESIVRRGKAIDGAFAILRDQIEPIEAYLLEQETFAERVEADRRAKVGAARAEALRALGANPVAYSDLGAMDDETWEAALNAAKDARDARDRAAREAEEVRREAERIAAARREEERAERAKAEAARLERERVQAEENARLKREREELETKLAKERVERERAEREAAEVARAETARREAEAEAARLAELAPDREKLAAFAVAVRALPVPDLTTEAGKAAREKLVEQVAKFARWVETTGAKL